MTFDEALEVLRKAAPSGRSFELRVSQWFWCSETAARNPVYAVWDGENTWYGPNLEVAVKQVLANLKVQAAAKEADNAPLQKPDGVAKSKERWG